MVDWVSLAVPFAYLGVLIGSLATFASLYRKRKVAKSASLEPWFGSHLQRNIYLSLLHLEQQEPGKEKPIQVPDTVIKSALLRRAQEDINRIISVRSSKQALNTLLARGSVGDDLSQQFQRAEKELEAELEDVVNEANALQAGWGQTIFQSANEIAANQRLRNRIAELQQKKVAEREWWDKRRETTQQELLAEVESEQAATSERKPSVVSSSDGEPVFVEGGGPSAAGGKKKKNKGKK